METARPSDLGRCLVGFEIWLSLARILQATARDLFSVVLSSTPLSRCVNSQLLGLLPVGILNSLLSICNICLVNKKKLAVGAVASCLAHSTLDRAVRVRALAGDMLRSQARHFILCINGYQRT